MTKPVWLLDLDGVINAIPARKSDPLPRCWPEEAWIRTEVKNSHNDKPWPILAARPVLDFVYMVHNEGLAEIRWHTTWQEEANSVSVELDLPEFDVEPAPEYEGWTMGAKGWWKVPAAKRACARTNGHLIWTDDDATYPSLSKLDRTNLRNAGTLIVAPRESTGLVQANLDKILFYLVGEAVAA